MTKRLMKIVVAGALVAAFLLAQADAGNSSAGRSRAAVYLDPVGDAGDAPDIAAITIAPTAGGVVVDVKLGAPTVLGPYGWILIGLDTDRDRATGDVRGHEFLVLANGDRVLLTRWDGRHLAAFPHRPLRVVESPTDISFTLSAEDLGSRSFDFSAASLRQDADLAPDDADRVFTYAPVAGAHTNRRDER